MRDPKHAGHIIMVETEGRGGAGKIRGTVVGRSGGGGIGAWGSCDSIEDYSYTFISQRVQHKS